MRLRTTLLLLSLAVVPVGLARAQSAWNVGAARVSITPAKSLWMGGFSDRTKPSDGVGLDLHARAVAFEDSSGRRAVIVSVELVGLPANVSRTIADRANRRYGLSRDRLLLNVTHTHCGPVVDHLLDGIYDLTPQQWADVEAYARELEDKVVDVIGEALHNLAPARLSFGQTNASFGVNRRLDEGRKWGPNYAGPADHDVPVLRVEGEHGEVRAVLFGFGCHASTLPPPYHKYQGDYPGVASKCLEARHPDAVALFVMGAGGDVKPFPCNTLELVEKYGELLAATVEYQMTEEPMVAIGGPLKSTYETVPLAFAPPPSKEVLKARMMDSNEYVRRHAAGMLKILDRDGHLRADYPDPLQAWQFGQDLTLVAMGGEVLSDYSLRLKRELPGTRLWVAGYSNDIFAYVPSLRVLKEGGYEGGGSMRFYMLPGPWAPSIEDTIITKVHELIGRVQAQVK